MTNNFINDFKNKSLKPYFNIHHINWWLMKYENDFYDSISKSECRKWSKWVMNNSIHVFPCCCPKRVEDCIFIEMYFELLKASELEKKEVFFEKALQEYNSIKTYEYAVSLWIEKHKTLWDNMIFNDLIKIKTSTEPYVQMKIQLGRDDFKNTIKFNKLYSRYYYAAQRLN